MSFDSQPLAPFLRGTNATYSCDRGYGLDGGDVVRTCLMNGYSPDGVWSGMEPACVGENKITKTFIYTIDMHNVLYSSMIGSQLPILLASNIEQLY